MKVDIQLVKVSQTRDSQILFKYRKGWKENDPIVDWTTFKMFQLTRKKS